MSAMKRYAIAEAFHTLQGEGRNAGTPAVFLRFAACNLWNGKERDRATAVCQFCDVPAAEVAVPGVAGATTFAGTLGPNGGSYNRYQVKDVVEDLMPDGGLVVLTGGEPMLQVDEDLTDVLRQGGYTVAMETNGTIPVPRGLVDHLTVSPKAGAPWKQVSGTELKLIYHQPELEPRFIEAMMRKELRFEEYFLQPMEPPPGPAHGQEWDDVTQRTLEYVLAHPAWRLSLQTHKVVRLP